MVKLVVRSQRGTGIPKVCSWVTAPGTTTGTLALSTSANTGSLGRASAFGTGTGPFGSCG